MKSTLNAIAVAALCLSSTTRAAGSDKLLEFLVDGTTYQGKVELLGRNDCWLLERDGRMNHLRLDDVKSFRRVEGQFRPYRAVELRDQLRREFGGEYEVAGSGQYLVCAPRGRAKQYVALFEDVYRTFRANFGARGFQLSTPEFPLVAVVLRDRQSFLAYQKAEGVPAAAGLLGYYHPASNRVVLFESDSPVSLNRPAPKPAASDVAALPGFKTAIDGGLKDTMIHEAIHQAAFNTGLHSRIGESPRWVVEGLATVFEADGMRERNSTAVASAKSRINRGRFIDFQNFARQRRKEKSLEAFIATDDLFRSSLPDFYSQSWALSFFLIETRSRQYFGYLKQVAARDALTPYAPEQRLADFKSAFGDDVAWLEVEFLRYLDRLR